MGRPTTGNRQHRTSSRKLRAVLWSAAGFFALGYFPTMLLGSPVVSIAAAACLVIPFGSKSPTVRKGLVRGAGLGAVTGLAATAAIAALVMQAGPAPATRPAAPATAPAGGAASRALDSSASSPATAAGDWRPKPGSRPAATSAAASRPGGGPKVPSGWPVHLDLAAIGSRLIGGAAMLCAAVGALFAHMASKRRQRIEEEWRA